MDVIYYYCFLFYKRILKDDEPYATTVWAFGFGEGYLLTVVINCLIIRFANFEIIKYSALPIIGTTLLLNYLYFNKSGRSRKIVKEKPMYFNSQKFSVFVTILFFLIIISSLFWGPIYSKYLLSNAINDK